MTILSPYPYSVYSSAMRLKLSWFVGGFILLIAACSLDEPPPPPLPSDVTSLARGQQLVEGLAACGFCHSLGGKPHTALSGGRAMSDIFGDVQGPNLTPSQSGMAQWSEENLRALFRRNQRADGSYLYSSFHKGIEWISDSDLTAIVSYLRSLPGVDNVVDRREIGFISRNTTGFFSSVAAVMGYVPQISPKFRVEYGEYLTNSVAGCDRCHSRPGGTFSSDDFMAGGREVSFDGEIKIAPNITSSKEKGIGSWSDDAMKGYLRSGTRPDGTKVDARFCPVEFYQGVSTEEIEGVVAYLRTIPAID